MYLHYITKAGIGNLFIFPHVVFHFLRIAIMILKPFFVNNIYSVFLVTKRVCSDSKSDINIQNCFFNEAFWEARIF